MNARTDPSIEAFTFKASVTTLTKDQAGRRTFEAVFYSGELIPNHWFWGNLVFDIATTKAKDRTGVLLQHDPNKIVGSGVCSFGATMKISGLLSAKSDAAKFVAEQADEGFPWQMSHFIEPGEIDQVQAGKKVTVNGREFIGPVTVFRNNLIRHVTFCADGADPNTRAQVFDRGGPSSGTQAAPRATGNGVLSDAGAGLVARARAMSAARFGGLQAAAGATTEATPASMSPGAGLIAKARAMAAGRAKEKDDAALLYAARVAAWARKARPDIASLG